MKYSADDLLQKKSKEKIAVLTAYTTPIARCLEQAGVAAILVGDTVGMVEMGFSSTRDVTMAHMIYHIGAVRRGAPETHIIGDMPYNSDEIPEEALRNAQQLIEAGADSVKLEGPKFDVIRHLVAHGIPVVGHTGLTPQTATNFKQVGKDANDAQRLLNDAKSIAEAEATLRKHNLPAVMMVDCSHANSEKKHARQEEVWRSVIEQRVNGTKSVIGMMVESHLNEGNQPFPQPAKDLLYGVSITDACVSWETTERMLRWGHEQLAAQNRATAVA